VLFVKISKISMKLINSKLIITCLSPWCCPERQWPAYFRTDQRTRLRRATPPPARTWPRPGSGSSRRATRGNPRHLLTLRLRRTRVSRPQPGVNFINIFTRIYYAQSSQKRKSKVKSSVSFFPFRIFVRKSCS